MTGLFDPLPGQPSHTVSIGGFLESPGQLGAAFLKASEVLIESWVQTSQLDDDYALPILQNLRHAIELILKSNCIAAAQSVRMALGHGYGTDTIPANLDDRLGKTHSVAQLVNLVNKLVGGLESPESGLVPDDIRETLAQLHSWDGQGYTFRYDSHKVKGQWVPFRPNVIDIDLFAGITRLHAAAELLHYGFDGWLDAYNGSISDMASEAKQYRDYY